MSARPLLYDVFSGAGGAARGYQLAGFRVIGIDHQPQPRYGGDGFLQLDAFEFFARYQAGDYEPAAAIHCSPPCQSYSRCAAIRGRDLSHYPQLVPALRALLERLGTPWVIENVPGAPFRSGVELCGAMFGLRVFRHRRFESSHLLLQPEHPRHTETVKAPGQKGRLAGYVRELDRIVTVAGHLFSLEAGAAAMGIDWMRKAELAEAIPPAYTHWLGRQLLQLAA